MTESNQGISPNSRLLAGSVADDTSGRARRYRSAVFSSLLSHGAILLIALFAITWLPDPAPGSLLDRLPQEIVWLNQPGPGGGGGGGNKMPEPPRKAETPGPDKVTVPVAKPPTVDKPVPPKDVPKPEQQMVLPAQPAATGVLTLPGAPTNLPTVSVSTGSGTGTGSGSGTGSGLGPGYGGGFGGGAYKIGNGVISPQLVHEVKPNYTAEAMRAKIQGVVTLEAVVLPDGSVGPVRVTRSLDPNFGLDQEAERTVKKWRFAPGTRFGQAVPVLVEIEMTFTLR